jgi:hypothetical protein
VSLFVNVVTFPKCAVAFVNTAVTDIRRLIEAETYFFLVISTNAVAEFAEPALPRAVGFIFAKLTLDTVFAEYASVGYASVSGLIAGDGVFTDFPRNSRGASSKFPGNSFD